MRDTVRRNGGRSCLTNCEYRRTSYQEMPREDFSIVYSGNSVQADLLKSILKGNGIQCVLQHEYVGMMRPYFIPGGVKVPVAASDVDKARRIVEDFIKDTRHK